MSCSRIGDVADNTRAEKQVSTTTWTNTAWLWITTKGNNRQTEAQQRNNKAPSRQPRQFAVRVANTSSTYCSRSGTLPPCLPSPSSSRLPSPTPVEDALGNKYKTNKQARHPPTEQDLFHEDKKEANRITKKKHGGSNREKKREERHRVFEPAVAERQKVIKPAAAVGGTRS